MNQERAQYILKNCRLLGGDLKMAFKPSYSVGDQYRIYQDGITQAEDAYIRKAWDKLPGNSCYMSVIYAIAQGINFLVNEEDKVDYLLGGFEHSWETMNENK